MADKFVDFGAANDGDGTSYAQAGSPGGVGAYNTLVSKTFAAGDKVWIRRVAKSMGGTALTEGTNLTVGAGTLFIGWPKSGDTYYATRPAAAQATWDPDGGNYAEINWTTPAITGACFTTNTFTGQEFHRMRFVATSATLNFYYIIKTNILSTFYNCAIENNSISAQNGSCLWISAGAVKCDGCLIQYNGTGNGGVMVYSDAVSYDNEFINCTFNQLYVSPTTTRVLYFNNTGTNYIIGCVVYGAGTAVTNEIIYTANNASILFMNDVTIDSDSAANQVIVNVGAGTAGTLARIVAFNLTITKCRTINISGSSYVHFRKFAQTTLGTSAPNYAINVFNPGTIIAGSNFSFQPGNALGDICIGNGIYYFLQNVTFASSTPMGPTPTDFPGVWIADDLSTVGYFHYRGQKGEVSSNAVYRTGGESFSLKFDLNSGSAPFWKNMIPIIPGFETIWVSLPASASTVTIYGAHKLYSTDPPTKKDIWMETDYLADASGARRAFASSRATTPTALDSDASSWNGDTGLTIFKMSLTFTPGQACLCPIRMYSTKRVTAAFVYIDPKPVVT